MSPLVVRVALPVPVRHLFDYCTAPGKAGLELRPGVRVRVPFARGTRIGFIVETAAHSQVAPQQLKAIIELIDNEPILSAALIELLRWSSEYYHHPIGEVFASTVPTLLRRGRPARVPSGEERWVLTAAGSQVVASDLSRAPRQARLLAMLKARPEGLLPAEMPQWRSTARTLVKKGWVTLAEVSTETKTTSRTEGPTLTHSQQAAVRAVRAGFGRFGVFLINGVTGSGKTEVYLRLIEHTIASGYQALVLIPEIGLTPQIVARFEQRLHAPIALLHSGLSDQQRLRAWLEAKTGQAAIVIGTRSAVFVPLSRPGLFIVDEEHDTSYKQQDGFRYCARDVCIRRAQLAAVPVVLGSATPALESLHNVARKRYQTIVLPDRVGGAREPSQQLLDIRAAPLDSGISSPLLAALSECLARHEQALLFVNRRGYAPVLMCHQCGWAAECKRCDAHLVYHRAPARLRCHHCGSDQPVPARCPKCARPDPKPLGCGTQRVAQALARHFPDAQVCRVDRDVARRRGAWESITARIHRGLVDVLVGTQMVTKGHHFPNVTLVGIVDADGGLFSADFRASERLAQLLVQVSGRAGRGQRPGRVLIQTHHPEHPLLRALVSEGYSSFAREALRERLAAGWPPHTSLALVRAESAQRSACGDFLHQAREVAQPLLEPGVAVLGPVAAPLERRAGRFRAHLLIEARERSSLQRLLRSYVALLERLKSTRRVRWSVDVDPVMID